VTYQDADSVRREGLRQELAPGNGPCIGGARG
jgi:hypothetical protein